MVARKIVWDAIAAAATAQLTNGDTITRADVVRAIRKVAVQAAEDSWTTVDNTAGARRWRRVDGDRRWYVAEVTTPAGMRMVELYAGTTFACFGVYAPGTTPVTEDTETGSPLDGYVGIASEPVLASTVTTNAKAWAVLDARVAAGVS